MKKIVAYMAAMALAFACALLGDGLRDALDPKLNK